MNQITPWMGSPSPPGCAPCFDPAALLQCWCDIQATTDIISKIMLDQIQNNPAMAQAMVEAIAKSGSSIPLVGVTNGVAAQPGQVGEWFGLSNNQIPYPAGNLIQTVTLGVLQPGDWTMWAYASVVSEMNEFTFNLEPVPAGFGTNLVAFAAVPATLNEFFLVSQTGQALTSVPSLVSFVVSTAGAVTGGNMTMTFVARRAR